MARPVEGAALLVAGHGTTTARTLGQIGEALLATGAPWQIRRLSDQYDRGTLKHHIDALVAEPVRIAMLVMRGVIADAGGPALVTSSQLRAYPEDAALPLAWIGERLRALRAEQLLVVMAGRPEAAVSANPRAWLDTLATKRREHVIAVAESDDIVDAVLAGVCGDALDPKTGTITMKSLADYLGQRVPQAAVQGSDMSQTLAVPPPLLGLWDVRRSQLAMLGTTRRSQPSSAPDDLTGTVLPGRFRIDALIARGTFGTVYRARQLAVERDVAVKVLHADIDPSSDDGRLFVDEVRAVGRIDHANVVRIHQADITHDGRLFYAMELLDGRDLQQLVGDGAMPKQRALELVVQLLAALGAAHDAHLVHADVKPANAIVVERDGKERLVLVDFGLARLRAPDRAAAESAGGTPAYMAPEQLHEGRVDARSDVFSAALVLVTLLTGWRRPNAHTLLPPLESIEDGELRRVLERALALEPGDRYQSAGELAAALTGTNAPVALAPLPRPFRQLAPVTEGRLYGREADLAVLTDHVLYRRSVVYTAPSGTGKTSLLCAGLVPRLEALGRNVAYVRCRNAASAVAAIDEVATREGDVVLVLDQLETALGDGDVVGKALAANATVVLSVREDHLARLLARALPGTPIVRLPPLDLDGARAAIVGPLAEARLAIEPALLDALLADLQRAAAALAPELGWGDAPAVFPPHLQLACSVLHDALGAGEATLTLDHYKRLGGFEAIVGEHLERVLDIELAGGDDVIARDLFVALVTAAGERAMRSEAELVAIASAKHDSERVLAVLELLRQRGLLVRVRGEAEPSWELVHDSLVPRVLAWIDRRDLARRRAIELVRYHLRRSQPDAPSLLDRSELRELRAHRGAIAELDAEWQKTRARDAWTPARLVERSQQALRRRTLSYAGIVAAALSVSAGAIARDRIEEARRKHEESLSDRDIGRFALELAPIDWDPARLVARPVDSRELPALRWELHYPAEGDPDAPGKPFEARHISRDGAHVEARGGRAFLVIDGRGRGGEHCAPSVVPVTLPGYAQHADEKLVRVTVPTCRASAAGMVKIASGRFIFGGVGEPPSSEAASYAESSHEQWLALRAFAIDRTEVTNAAFGVFAAMSSITGIAAPSYPNSPVHLGDLRAGDHPVTDVTWVEARAYCAWLGKRLPTSQEWQRALRGGERLPDRSINPHPRRNFPWIASTSPTPAKLLDASAPGTAAVGSFPDDRSPDGVLDLAGNAVEWTDSREPDSKDMRIVRGGGALEVESLAKLAEFTAIENPRPVTLRYFDLGMRCAYTED